LIPRCEGRWFWEAFDGQMLPTRLQILAESDHFNSCTAQESHGIDDFLIALTDADHDARFDADIGA
jgi:hypothetical protein